MNSLQRFDEIFKKMNRFDQTMGLSYEIQSPGKIVYRMQIQERHLSSPEFCHGGALAGMMDAVLGLTVISYAITLDKFCSTVESKSNFLTPARLGQKLIGRGEIDYKGQSLVVCSGLVVDEDDPSRLVMKGIGTFNLYPASKHQWSGWGQAT